MSEAVQYDLENEPAGPKRYLTKRFPGENRHNVTAIHQEAEWYCNESVCHNRVTLSPTGEIEYGHAKQCPHSVWDGDSDD